MAFAAPPSRSGRRGRVVKSERVFPAADRLERTSKSLETRLRHLSQLQEPCNRLSGVGMLSRVRATHGCNRCS